MSIKVGDRIPSMTLMHMTEKGPGPVTTEELFGKKKVVLFAVPGAYTPTCSARHLPGYVEHAADFKKKGVDAIVCLSVNDAFVMDASKFGMGVRSQRYAAVIEDMVVKSLEVEEPGAFKVSSADHMLGVL